MSKKILILFLFFFLTACGASFLISGISNIEKPDLISLELTSSLGNNTGSLIRLSVASQNNPWWSEEEKKKDEHLLKLPKYNAFYPYDEKQCETQSLFFLVFSTPKKRPKDRRYFHPEFNFLLDGRTGGRFKINKSDIYLIHQGKKIYPDKIYLAQQEFDSIESNYVNYSNYHRYGRRFLTFPIPCTSLISTNGALSDTKLIISKIYKDDKVIKRDIEFRFIKSKENRGYTIWLE